MAIHLIFIVTNTWSPSVKLQYFISCLALYNIQQLIIVYMINRYLTIFIQIINKNMYMTYRPSPGSVWLFRSKNVTLYIYIYIGNNYYVKYP